MVVERGFKIDKERMMRMLKDGQSQASIARHFGCSVNAIRRMKNRIEEKVAAVPDLQRSELSRHNIDTVHQLKSMNDHILDELKRCRRLITREDNLVQEREDLEDAIKKDPDNDLLKAMFKKLAGDNIAAILKIQSNIIAISGEVRKQIELQVKIYETIYNVTMVSEFQEEIIEILRTVDPDLKDRVIKRLKERRSIRGLVRVDK